MIHTAVSTGGLNTNLAVSITNTVYLSIALSLCSPCLCNLTRTMFIGLPSLSTPCKKLFPFLICAKKSSPSFFAKLSPVCESARAPASPDRMISSSTWISWLRQRIVDMSMTSARWMSHFRARRKRRRSASGWSDFTIDQNAARRSSGDISFRVCWNSLVWPYLSSGSPVPGPEWLELVSVVSSSWCFLLPNNEGRFLPLLVFFADFGESESVFGSLVDRVVAEIPGAAAWRDGSLTPKVLRVKDQKSRSFSSCSGVRLPRWPGGVGISE
jgi:hypothetical protein